MTVIGDWLETLETTDYCWWCLRRFDSFEHRREVHHLHRRGAVPKAKRDDWTNLFLCGTSCHAGPLAVSNPSTQAAALARKAIYDPSNFDLERWCRLRGEREVNRITWPDVAQHLAVKPGRF